MKKLLYNGDFEKIEQICLFLDLLIDCEMHDEFGAQIRELKKEFKNKFEDLLQDLEEGYNNKKLIGDYIKKIGVIKIHRLGKGNFRTYKKLREYLAIKHHSSSIYNSRLAAHHEAKSLKRVEGIISATSVWGFNLHCLLMDYIEGIELYKCRRLK